MNERQRELGTGTKTRLQGQTARKTREQETEDRLSFHRDPLTLVTTRPGDASSARAHASLLNRVTANQPSRAAHSLLHLQRQYGNRYVQRMVEVMRSAEGRAEVAPEVEEAIQRARGNGRALDSGMRAQMESAFDADFSHVHVHSDAEADALNREVNARAFTTGQDIFFRDGEYSPSSSGGRELLAHELTHVVQQAGSTVQGQLVIGMSGDEYEQEADRMAETVTGLPKSGATTAFKPRARCDFSQVRVHTDALAAQSSRAALTVITQRSDSTEQAASIAVQRALEQGSIPTVMPTSMYLARAEPEIASTKRVRYEPGERETSASSPGKVDSQGEFRHTLFDFEVNQDRLKPEHQQFLEMLVGRFALHDTNPRASIRLVEGYTDLVDTETVNEPLRQRRAEAVVQFLVTERSVPAANIDVFRGAPAGELLANNASREGRSINRATVIQLEEISEVPRREKETEHKRQLSRQWALRSAFTTAYGEILGLGGGIFQLKDRSTGQERVIAFYGAGLAGGLSLPRITASLTAKYEEFETTRPHSFWDFEGPGWIDLLSFDVVAYGYQLGHAHFQRIETTDHKGIWIGGHQAGGLGISGAILVGDWRFISEE